MNDLLLPAYQKLYAALVCLERFSKGQDLFENIVCIDSFLSELRNVTFVLQKSLAHTDYLTYYNTLKVKHLNNDDCSWLVNKRNEVLKEKPFNLVKTLCLTLYHPNGAGVFSMESYSAEDERDYSSLIEIVKGVIEKIPAIEVYFSVEFVYSEKDSQINIFSTIKNGINSMFSLLEDLNKVIGGNISKSRLIVQDKIKNLHFYFTPNDAWFVDDYVYYRKNHVFEKGERSEIITPFNTAVPYTLFCGIVGVKNKGNMIEETFEAFERMHIYAFKAQKSIAPTFLLLKEDGTMSMVMYQASIKTTTYRKIHEIAENIKKGVPIISVFYVCEMLSYNNLDAFDQDYSYRSSSEHSELLTFNIVTQDGAILYCISSEAILEDKKSCLYPTLTRVETDDSISYMNPLVDALKNS